MDQRAENKKQDLRTVKQGTENTRKERYEDIRSQIKDGDVLMFKGRYFTSSIIRWLTGSFYSHAGIAVWWNRRLMVMEAVERGVGILPLSRKIGSYRGDVEWFCSKKEIPERDRLRMILFAQEELGKSYARWREILFGWKILLRRNLSEKDELRRENKLYCSQYVARIYNAIGLDLKKNRDDRFMSPDDVANSPLLEKRGVFKIKDYIYLIPEVATEIDIP